jgi:DNA (cytosine-5)-methyltransferase 1
MNGLSNVVIRPLSTLSLCTGIGGLELGLRLALGSVCVGYVERESFAAATLVARMEEAVLDPAPVWDDVKTFDGTQWRGKVDCITAGFPCQPFSLAGTRQGDADPRHLWPDIVRIIREADPWIVILENVPGLLVTRTADGRNAGEVVKDDLEQLGFDVEAGLFSAEDVTATHKRERVFYVGIKREMAHCAGVLVQQLEAAVSDALRCCSEEVADAWGGFIPVEGWGSEGRDGTGPAGPSLVDTSVERRTALDAGPVGRQAWHSAERPGEELADASVFGMEGLRAVGEQEPAVSAGEEVPRRDGGAMGCGQEALAHSQRSEWRQDEQHQQLSRGRDQAPGRSSRDGEDVADAAWNKLGDTDTQAYTLTGERSARSVSDGRSGELADADGGRLEVQWTPLDFDGRDAPGHDADGSGARVLADADSDTIRFVAERGERHRGSERATEREHAIPREALSLFPPGPSDFARWADVLVDRPDLAPAVERPVRRVADGDAGELGDPEQDSRSDQLRALGNAVVPLTAALAITTLVEQHAAACRVR